VLCAFATTILAAPLVERAAARTFAELTISAGTAGDAEAEANAKFPTPANLSGVSAADLQTLQAEKKLVESAEVKGFDPAIKAATNNSTKKALKNGKTKNKVLKITVEVLVLEIQKAKGKNTTAKIAKEKKKLDKAIKLDKAAAGQQSETVKLN